MAIRPFSSRAAAVLLVLSACLASLGPAIALPPPDRLAILELLRAGDFPELERVLGQYHEAYDAVQTSDVTVELAYNAFRSADPDLAPMLDRWIDAFPTSHAARLARGLYRHHLGAVMRGDKYAAKTPSDAMGGMRDQFRLARQDIRAALDLKPNLGLAYASLIGIAMAAGPSETIDDLFDRALEADPRSFTVRSIYLHSLKPWWNGKRARRHYPINHWLVAIWRVITGTMQRNDAYAREMVKRQMEEIRDRLDEAPELALLLGYADYIQAEVLARRGRRDKADAYFQRALEAGEFIAYSYGRGLNHWGAGRYDQAITSFSRALALRPDRPNVLKYRALMYRQTGEFDLALADVERALVFEPYDPGILAEHAWVLGHLGRLDEALESLDKAMVYGRHESWVWYTRGWHLFYGVKDRAEAIPYLKRATELEPRRSLYWYVYGHALYGAEDCDSVKALEEYLRLCRRGGKDCHAGKQEKAAYALDQIEINGYCPPS